MKTNRYTQIKVITDTDPKEFERKFNETQIDLRAMNPETSKMEITQEGMIAVISYVVEQDVPESARDEMSLQGLHFTCRQCPNFNPVRNNDGSVRRTSKRGSCFLKEQAWADSSVCEDFCKKYLLGEIKVRDGYDD